MKNCYNGDDNNDTDSTSNLNTNLNRNKSGYFYYQLSGDVLPIDSSNPQTNQVVTIEKPTVLYVVGGDVYIKRNIKYSTVA